MQTNYITLLFLLFINLSVKATEVNSIILQNESIQNNDLLLPEENIDENSAEEIVESSISDNDISSIIEPKAVTSYRSPLKAVAKFAWGTPVDDGILTGMLSYHTDTESRRHDRWNHNLVGLQYKGFIASTFTIANPR